MEDIFEAEDSVPADPTPDSLDELSEFFSPLTVDWTRPSLNTRTISKLTAIIDQVARPTKRIRRDHAFHSPSAADREGTSGIDTQQLLRIIKMLERSVFMGEDVDPLAGPTVKLSESNSGGGEDTDNKFSSKNKKSKRAKTPDGRKSRSKSRTPVEPEDVDRREEIEVDHEKVDHDLQLAKEAIIAADACLALLASNQLPKQVCSIRTTPWTQFLSILLAVFRGIDHILPGRGEEPSDQNHISVPRGQHRSSRFVVASIYRLILISTQIQSAKLCSILLAVLPNQKLP